jgi:hypothetical protein
MKELKLTVSALRTALVQRCLADLRIFVTRDKQQEVRAAAQSVITAHRFSAGAVGQFPEGPRKLICRDLQDSREILVTHVVTPTM